MQITLARAETGTTLGNVMFSNMKGFLTKWRSVKVRLAGVLT